MRRLAQEAFQEVLNLSDEQMPDNFPMKDYININEPDEGDTLVMEDSNDSPSLMLVLSGTVELSQVSVTTLGKLNSVHKIKQLPNQAKYFYIFNDFFIRVPLACITWIEYLKIFFSIPNVHLLGNNFLFIMLDL